MLAARTSAVQAQPNHLNTMLAQPAAGARAALALPRVRNTALER